MKYINRITENKFDITEILLIVAIICVAAFTVCFVIMHETGKDDSEYDKTMVLAEQYFEAGEYADAENTFLKAIGLEPKEAEPYLKVAEIRYNQGNYDSAIAILNEAKHEKCNDEDEIDNLIVKIKTATEQEDAVNVEEIDKSSLVDFFETFEYYCRNTTSDELYYDYKTADPEQVMGSIMWSIQCVDYSIYPGEVEREEHWDGTNTDPLEWASGGKWGYYVYDADKVNWIAHNILNLTKDQIDGASQTDKPGDSMDAEDNYYYLNNGKYYEFSGGIGWEEGYSVNIDSIEENNGNFDIIYTNTVTKPTGTGTETEVHQYSAKMKYKEIDGEHYWSLYQLEEL